jgi:hypothetical protein
MQIAKMTDAEAEIKDDLRIVIEALFALTAETRSSARGSLGIVSQAQLRQRLTAICERMSDYPSLRRHIAGFSTRLHDDPEFLVPTIPRRALLEYANRLLEATNESFAKRDEIWKMRRSINEELDRVTARLSILSTAYRSEQSTLQMEECLTTIMHLQEELMSLERDDVLRQIVGV